MTVVVLGDANVDLLVQLPEREPGAPPPALTPPQLFGGGTAGNTAVALARLDVPVTFAGMVGDDGYGRFVQADLAGEGVDTAGLRFTRDVFTPMVIAMIAPDGERMPVVWPPEGGADKYLRIDDLDVPAIEGAAWLHTTGMVLRNSPVRETVLHAMQIARAAGVPVSVDLNLRLELWGWGDDIRATAEQAVALADVVFGSGSEEIAPLAGVDDVAAAARTLAGDARVVVGRLGAEGALAALPGGAVQYAPAFPTQLVDTLGAGDAFNGGFIAARLAGEDTESALRWGNAVAALACQQAGARAALTRADMLDMVRD